ncbi:hypothetical protein KUTeg_012232 [Tegillarca granosa]|uniref:Uncharacterized protein n=1 Tax=Tegillarca granosa TaxID=220873 RepID=A0ABQ9F268_TEGGR|nr:hypothetical protein KUTeg_012232 [Tegillarca granosa]
MSERMKKASKEASEKSFREQLKDIGSDSIKARDVSEHEAVARIMSLPMRKSNLQVKFIPTGYKENRTRMLKPLSVIETMKDDDTDIYNSSIIDKFAARPDSLLSVCHTLLPRTNRM